MHSFLAATATVLTAIVYCVGFCVAIWAFSYCRSRGYLVMGLYFVLCLFTLLVMPSIHRAIDSRHRRTASEEAQYRINQAVQDAMHHVMVKQGLHPAGKDISFPFGPILLVTGFWLVAKQDAKRAGSARSPFLGRTD